MLNRKGLMIFTSLLIWPGLAQATPATLQLIEKQWKTCDAAVRAAEARAGIPKHLLGAIAKAESGRWHPNRQANIAWPWTVTANGKGRFFDSKAEAVAEAEILLTEGVRNIDVGCMQINLMYHDSAFESLAKAFDPAANAQYGAKYLKAMHDKTKDWRAAAAHYHSTTPEQAARYRAKVLRLWEQARNPADATKPALKTAAAKTKVGAGTKDAAEGGRARASAIDFGRMQNLNAAFRQRQEKSAGEELADQAAHRAHMRREQLDAWRERKADAIPLVHLANMRRAELAQRRRKELSRVSARDRTDAFAERRRDELERWRTRRLDPHFNAYPQ